MIAKMRGVAWRRKQKTVCSKENRPRGSSSIDHDLALALAFLTESLIALINFIQDHRPHSASNVLRSSRACSVGTAMCGIVGSERRTAPEESRSNRCWGALA